MAMTELVEYCSWLSPPTMTTIGVDDDAEADVDATLAALVVYVVVSAVPLTVTVAVTVTMLAGSVAVAAALIVPAAFEADVVVVFPVAIAFDWKVSKLLPRLMAKTMPCCQ